MERLVDAAVELGVAKIRLTGGEPLARKAFVPFLRRLREEHPDVDLRLTTNATLIEPHLDALAELGLGGINVSLDSLDRATFERVTGRDELHTVRAALDGIMERGIKLKINLVAMRGVNDNELGDFLALAKDNPLDVRCIEFMPVGAATRWSEDMYWSATDILAEARKHAELDPLIEADEKAGPARIYSIKGGKGRFGLITPLSNHFCDRCNRLRVTSDGSLRTCLFSDREAKLRPILRHPKLGRAHLVRVLSQAVRAKPIGADILAAKRKAEVAIKQMSAIGG
jgi:cyclic pyranopterin phosphate synthase